MDRAEKLRVATLAVAAAAATFSFIAMLAAIDARDVAEQARDEAIGSRPDPSVSFDIYDLHKALVDAGVVSDPEGRFNTD